MHWQWQFMLCLLLKHTNSLHTAKMGAFWRSVLVPSVLSSALLCRLLYLMKCANTESSTLKFSTVLHCVDCSVTLKRVPLDFQFWRFWCSDLLDAGFICLQSADLSRPPFLFINVSLASVGDDHDKNGDNDWCILQGVFFNWPSPFSVPKRKMAFSQWELLFHEILHLRKPLVGSLAYFLFGTEQGGAS